MSLCLTDAELADCTGHKQPAAQARWLKAHGFHFFVKANGRPLVGREHFNQVMAGRTIPSPSPAPQGNVAGVVKMFQSKPIGTTRRAS